MPEKKIEKQLGKETLTLWKHLHRTPATSTRPWRIF
jgi:hypothetical protein